MKKSLLNFALPITIGVLGGVLVIVTTGGRAEARAARMIETKEASPVVQRLFDQSKADAVSLANQKLTLEAFKQNQRARTLTVRDLYSAGDLMSMSDFLRTAEVLSKSEDANDMLLSHDLAVLAASMGSPEALVLAAQTEDRFLELKGLPARFGTTKGKSSHGTPVADWHRRAIGYSVRSRVNVVNATEPTTASLRRAPTLTSGVSS